MSPVRNSDNTFGRVFGSPICLSTESMYQSQENIAKSQLHKKFPSHDKACALSNYHKEGPVITKLLCSAVFSRLSTTFCRNNRQQARNIYDQNKSEKNDMEIIIKSVLQPSTFQHLNHVCCQRFSSVLPLGRG